MKTNWLVLSLSAAILTATPLFATDNGGELLKHPVKAHRASLEDMPKDIIRNILETKTEDDERRNLFNLGKVCKALYDIYTSEYIVGQKTAGVLKSSQFISDISKLFKDEAVNFKVSNGKITSFNFSDPITWGKSNYCSNSWDYEYKHVLKGQHNDSVAEEVNILTSERVEAIDQPFPFEGKVSKIVYKEDSWPGHRGEHFHPNNPNRQWCSRKEMATYTLYGKDKTDKKVHISYEFFRDFPNKYY